MNKAVILGATGAVGNEVFKKCVNSNYYDKIYVFGRHSVLDLPINKKVERFVIDFDNIGLISDVVLEGADVFSCLGTTIKQASSKEVQRQVDYQYTINFAKKCENKVKSFTVISSLGADRETSNFYLSLKRQLERDLGKMNLGILRIIRPSLLLAKRQDRKLESIAITLAPLVSKLLVGNFKQYKPVEVEKVAKSMVHFATNNYPSGVYNYKDFLD